MFGSNRFATFHLIRTQNSTKLLPTLAFTIPSVTSSAQVTGSLTLDTGVLYEFHCTFDGVTFAFLWIDDHLVCQIGAYMTPNITLGPAEPSLDWGQDNPITVRNKTNLSVRLHVYRMTSGSTAYAFFSLMFERVSSHIAEISIFKFLSERQDLNSHLNQSQHLASLHSTIHGKTYVARCS